jgi:hypothetical protein
MKIFTSSFALTLCLCFSSLVSAQSTGRVECARNDGYVYLYSSLTTMDVRATLQCGEIVQITGRFNNNFYGVRTAKGDIGFVPLATIVLLKDQPGTGLPAPSSEPPARERMHYDEGPSAPPASARPIVPAFTLLNNTPVRVKLAKTISSDACHAGDPVEFEVVEDVLVEGIPVLTKGSKASGVIALVEPKKRFGHNGRLAVSITSVHLADSEQAPLRGYQEVSGSSNTSSNSVLTLAAGKDAAIPQGTEFTTLVDGDLHLKREAFAASIDAPATAPIPPAKP